MPECTYQDDAFTPPCGRPAPWVHDWRTMWDPDDCKPTLLCDLHAHEYAEHGLSVTRPGEKRFRPMPIENEDDASEVSYIRGAAPPRKPAGRAERALAVALVVMLAAIALAAAVLVFVAIVRLIIKVAGS